MTDEQMKDINKQLDKLSKAELRELAVKYLMAKEKIRIRTAKSRAKTKANKSCD